MRREKTGWKPDIYDKRKPQSIWQVIRIKERTDAYGDGSG